MDKISKFIDCWVPIKQCNLRCDYCYITLSGGYNDTNSYFGETSTKIREALSKKRLGGTGLINLCGGGETLISHKTLELMKELLIEGHYVMVVTNGTLSDRIDEIILWDKELLERLFFKFSFHYLQLKKKNWITLFFSNVNKIRSRGCSFTVELIPHDEIIDDIPEIKQLCLDNIGALCHVTVGRDESKPAKPLLTQYKKEEFYKIWSSFESELFEFKMKTFAKKINQCCYAGKLSYFLNLQSGKLKKCYQSEVLQNIFEDVNKPLVEKIVGEKCMEPHCYNSHVFMPLGVIPELEAPHYVQLRNRNCLDGSEWINGKFKEFISQKIDIK